MVQELDQGVGMHKPAAGKIFQAELESSKKDGVFKDSALSDGNKPGIQTLRQPFMTRYSSLAAAKSTQGEHTDDKDCGMEILSRHQGQRLVSLQTIKTPRSISDQDGTVLYGTFGTQGMSGEGRGSREVRQAIHEANTLICAEKSERTFPQRVVRKESSKPPNRIEEGDDGKHVVRCQPESLISRDR